MIKCLNDESIKMFETQKLLPVTEIEDGLNIDEGQWHVLQNQEEVLICVILTF